MFSVLANGFLIFLSSTYSTYIPVVLEHAGKDLALKWSFFVSGCECSPQGTDY